jgi:outer membrane protein assembly factor BamE (lipoprotein component of BamABCDE complex)
MKKILFILSICLLAGCATTINKQEYINKHPQLTEETKQAILNSKVYIGMTKEQVETSWGKPISISTTISSLGNVELWWYGEYSSCLSFAENKLMMIQQTK